MIPLHAFVEGDVIGLVVLADPQRTVAELVAQIERAASVRVRPTGRARLVFEGRALLGDAIVGDLGLSPLDRVDLHREVS